MPIRTRQTAQEVDFVVQVAITARMSTTHSREDLLRQAAALIPEEERADVLSLLDAGEWGEAAFQMRGGPGDREIPAEALALIDRAME